MEYITATINESGVVTLSQELLGNVGEHNSTTIKFIVPEQVTNEVDYFRLWSDGSFSEKMTADPTTGIVEFLVPQSMLKAPVIKMQLVGYRSQENTLIFVWRSKVFKFMVEISVDDSFPIPTKAYDPLEEALLQCASTIEFMRDTTNNFVVDTESLQQAIEDAAEQKRLAEIAVIEATTQKRLAELEVEKAADEAFKAEDLWRKCKEIKENCISYGISKITTKEEINSNRDDQVIATSNAVRDFVLEKETEIYGALAGNITLENDELSIATKDNVVLDTVSFKDYAKKTDLSETDNQILENSQNPVSSGAVYSELLKKTDKTEMDSIINSIFDIEYSVFDYSYLNYLKWDEPHTLKKGAIYKAIDACEYDGVFYPANTLYQWTGENWKEVDIIKYLRDQIPIKTSELEKDDVYTKDECNEYFSPTKNTISEFVIYLADNSEYYGTNISALDIEYPQGDFECWLRLTFANEGEITVRLPESQYIGSAPTFSNGETWEISIKDGVVIAQKVGA